MKIMLTYFEKYTILGFNYSKVSLRSISCYNINIVDQIFSVSSTGWNLKLSILYAWVYGNVYTSYTWLLCM